MVHYCHHCAIIIIYHAALCRYYYALRLCHYLLSYASYAAAMTEFIFAVTFSFIDINFSPCRYLLSRQATAACCFCHHITLSEHISGHSSYALSLIPPISDAPC